MCFAPAALGADAAPEAPERPAAPSPPASPRPPRGDEWIERPDSAPNGRPGESRPESPRPTPPRPPQRPQRQGRDKPRETFELRYTVDGILFYASSDTVTRYSSRADEEYYETAAAGRITIVPPTVHGWSGTSDLGAGTFEMTAPIRLPDTIVSGDVASIRAVFSDAVDRATISVDVDEDVTELRLSGTVAEFAPFGDIALRMIVLEKDTGLTLIQRMDIALSAVTGAW